MKPLKQGGPPFHQNYYCQAQTPGAPMDRCPTISAPLLLKKRFLVNLFLWSLKFAQTAPFNTPAIMCCLLYL